MTMEYLKQVLPVGKEASLSWYHAQPNIKIGPLIHDEDEYLICGESDFILEIDGVVQEHTLKGQLNYFYVPANSSHTMINKDKPFDYFLVKIKK